METLKPEKAGKGSAFRQPRKFTYSLATISILTAVFLLLFSLVVIGFVSVYFQGQFTDQYLDTIGRMESQINSDTEAAFNTLDRQLFQLGAYNTNVSLINTTSDAQVFYQAKMTLYKELTNLAPVFPEIDGLFFYSPSVDDYTPYVARAASYGCSEYVKRFLSDTREDFSRMQNVFKKWQLIRYEDSIYLVRYVYSGSGVLGAWTSVPTLIASFRNILPRESVVSMLDPECHLLQGDLFPDYVFDDISLTHYQSYTAPDGYRYMVNAHRTSYSDCYLIVFTPFSLLQSMLSPVFKNTLSMIGVIALAVLVFSALFKRMIGQPVKSMQQTLRALQDGKQKAPILPTDSRCLEVRQMFHVLNGMLDNIQTLEAQIYEDQLTQSRMELQFLKSQITPHFLINCLNTFSYLASSPDESDHDAAQRLTQTLSQHIRYSFATGDVIPLEQEFDQISRKSFL